MADLKILHTLNKFKQNVGESDEFYNNLDCQKMAEIWNFHKTIPGYEMTPLVSLEKFGQFSASRSSFCQR